MVFSSCVFLFVYLPLVFIIYYVFLKEKMNKKNMFLFIVSILFYAWGEPKFILIMLLSIFINWRIGILIDKYNNKNNLKKAKIYLVTGIIINVFILFIFKYLMFTINNINSIFNLSIRVPQIALPIGISFFTFQAISYIVDVYRKNGKVQKEFMNLGLYISFFPQLIAGPIVRYETVAYDIENRKESFEEVSQGVCRFIIGLAKKVIISNNLAIVADMAFSQGNLSVGFAWVGAIAYTFQIFFDFSGYSDMAIGLGKMFGFHFLENFNYPFISKSIGELWRRWHISLTTWFKDYVYFPLGGSRVKRKSRVYFNLFVVWFLTGIWHGANWTYLCWGMFFFILQVIEKITNFEKKKSRVPFLRHFYTMFMFVIGIVLFRASSIHDAFEYFKCMFGLSKNLLWDAKATLYIKENLLFFIIAIFASIPTSKFIKDKFKNKESFYDVLYVIGILAIFIISISFVVKGSYNPFIYFNF